jgi:hypoxanthine phosphoribosyltransferase
MDPELPDNSKLIFDNKAIIAALDGLAEKLNRRLAGENPVVLCVMQGGLVFAGQLIPKLNCMLEIDYLHATRYNNQTVGSDLFWKSYPATSLKGRIVLILDDILDEGLTLQSIIEYCQSQGAKKIISAVLLKKNHDRCVLQDSIQAVLSDNVALIVEDEYVFGFGMDYNGQYRQLDSIFALQENN